MNVMEKSGISINKYLAFGVKLDDDIAEHRNQLCISIIHKVLHILDKVFLKVGIAFIIPQLLQQPEVLKKYAPEDDVNVLLEQYAQYMYDTQTEEKMEDFTLNYHLFKVLEALFSNEEFQKLMPQYTTDMNKNSKFSLKEIENIVGVAEVRLQTSARVDLLREKYMQQAYRENEELKEIITGCRAHLYEKEAALQERIAKKKNDMKKYRQNIDNAYNAYKLEVHKTKEENCQKILQIKYSNETAEETLRDEAETSKTTYTRLLQENLKAEKKLREKKQKVLAQLLSLIEKYENDIVEKVLETDNMIDRTAEKRKELEDFMLVYNRQRQEYREVFNITDDDDEMSRETRIKNFTMNRAAKVIQRAWKLYLEMKMKMKKKKKGKGKKGKAKKATPKKEKETKEKKPAAIFDLESVATVEKQPKEKGGKKKAGAKGKKGKVKEEEVEVVTAVKGLEENESMIAEKQDTDMAEEENAEEKPAEEEKVKTEVAEEEKVDEGGKVENVEPEKQEENVPDQENKDDVEQEQKKDDAAIENQTPPGKGKASKASKKKKK